MTAPGIRKVMTRADLILFGLVILTPTAPYPVYGIIQQVSRGHATLSYLVALIAMLFTARSYAHMATAFPSAGSTYTYVQKTMSLFVGFLAGWAMLLDYFLIPLVSIVYAALTAARFVPQIPFSVWAVLFVLAIAAINIRGIRVLAHANTAMMVVMTGVAFLFIVLAARFVILHSGAEALFSIHDLIRPETLSVRPLMLGAAIATLSYIGFDAISTLAEETVDAKRDIGFATILVCILQAAICVLTVYLASLVWPEYHSFRDPETAILDLGIKVGGNLLFGVLTFVLLVAGLASALTGQAGASRLLFAMDRDGVFFGHIFSYIHPNFGTPIIAIWTVTAVSVVGALAMHFQVLVELLNFGAFVGFILVNLSVIQHYWVRSKQRGGRSLIDNAIFPFFGALVCGYVWLSLGTYAKVVGFCWLGFGSALALLVRRFYRTTSHPLRLENSSEWLK